MVFECERDHGSQWAAVLSIAQMIGCTAETLRTWVLRVEDDTGRCGGMTCDGRARIRQLERENLELRRARSSARRQLFRPRGARPPTEAMTAFVDGHRARFGVEPICTMLPIASSTYHEHKARQADPSRLPVRVQRGAILSEEIARVWEESRRLYRACKVKVGRQLRRAGFEVARCCTVERLMSQLGLAGAVRGGSRRRRSPTTLRPNRRPLSSATSPPLVRTSCGEWI